eukprot:Skav227034  [mRNA]  locus=scaffold635:101403:105792:- [translate_table: standard]
MWMAALVIGIQRRTQWELGISNRFMASPGQNRARHLHFETSKCRPFRFKPPQRSAAFLTMARLRVIDCLCLCAVSMAFCSMAGSPSFLGIGAARGKETLVARQDEIAMALLAQFQSEEFEGKKVMSFRDVAQLLEVLGLEREQFVSIFSGQAKSQLDGTADV